MRLVARLPIGDRLRVAIALFGTRVRYLHRFEDVATVEAVTAKLVAWDPEALVEPPGTDIVGALRTIADTFDRIADPLALKMTVFMTDTMVRFTSIANRVEFDDILERMHDVLDVDRLRAVGVDRLPSLSAGAGAQPHVPLVRQHATQPRPAGTSCSSARSSVDCTRSLTRPSAVTTANTLLS